MKSMKIMAYRYRHYLFFLKDVLTLSRLPNFISKRTVTKVRNEIAETLLTIERKTSPHHSFLSATEGLEGRINIQQQSSIVENHLA